MKQGLIVVFFIMLSVPSFSQEISVSDSVAISQKIEDWNQAWRVKDAALAAKWYSDDSDFTNAFGFSMIGRENIQVYLTEVFGFSFVMAGNSEQTSLKLKSLSDKSILAITTVERKGQKTVDNKSLGTRNTTHYRVFEKSDGWRITAHLISDARNTESEKH